ncbi:MAG: hypothetical protein KAT65_00690 [Methanophagales archaeon]|nr:hypothetical protein [Methanophagales archaeon]
MGVGSGNHGKPTDEMLKRRGDVLTKEAPDLLFCQTERAVKILEKGGIENDIYLTGDIMVNALQQKEQNPI